MINQKLYDNAGKEMMDLAKKLYPICRSITGDGVRNTLNELKEIIPINLHEVNTGKEVFDWTIPEEWNIIDAWVTNSKGEKIIDFKKNNLHVVNYSSPIRKKITFEELKKHIFTLPNNEDYIPYRTTYYKKDWGFCMSHKEFLKLQDDTYEVCIDSSLKNGSLSYGELYIKGETTDEILISTHICHPSLCNDNLSGIALATSLAKYLLSIKPARYSYRFLFIPGTIGSLTWLSQNVKELKKIMGGIVLTGVGDSGSKTYKRSRSGNAEVDKAFAYLFEQKAENNTLLDFSPFGYDERQFCSPGFNLPMGTFMRTPHGTYPEYHTSADNLTFINAKSLSDSFKTCLDVFSILQKNATYINTLPNGEPQLGKRGIYDAMGQQTDEVKKLQIAMLWVLNYSDGTNTILDIAEKSNIDFETVVNAANLLEKHTILKLL